MRAKFPAPISVIAVLVLRLRGIHRENNKENANITKIGGDFRILPGQPL
jgi:hypothetical protein